jgi:hypothetical protein
LFNALIHRVVSDHPSLFTSLVQFDHLSQQTITTDQLRSEGISPNRRSRNSWWEVWIISAFQIDYLDLVFAANTVSNAIT